MAQSVHVCIVRMHTSTHLTRRRKSCHKGSFLCIILLLLRVWKAVCLLNFIYSIYTYAPRWKLWTISIRSWVFVACWLMFEVYFVQAKIDVLDTCNLMMDQSFFLSQKVHCNELFVFCKKNFVFWEVIVSGSVLKKKRDQNQIHVLHTHAAVCEWHTVLSSYSPFTNKLTQNTHTHTQACGSQNPLKL